MLPIYSKISIELVYHDDPAIIDRFIIKNVDKVVSHGLEREDIGLNNYSAIQ